MSPDELDDDPIEQFHIWYAEAVAAGEPEPEAMSLATATAEGGPSVRFVLLKDVGPAGFVFYSNRTSRKGGELAANPNAALAWRWQRLERQARVTGTVSLIADPLSDAYFASRPRASQLGAWASKQSTVLADRAEFDRRYAAADARFAGGDVPRPPWWGGYVVAPDTVEFWQGHINRLHDRAVYSRAADGSWTRQRLAP